MISTEKRIENIFPCYLEQNFYSTSKGFLFVSEKKRSSKIDEKILNRMFACLIPIKPFPSIKDLNESFALIKIFSFSLRSVFILFHMK